MSITPDQIILWQLGPVPLNATVVFTWLIIALLACGAWLITRNLSAGTDISGGQNLLETLVLGMRDHISEISQHDPARYLPFVGTLFVFIAVSNILSVVPGFQPPTGSLSTTAALALCVFVAVPLYGVGRLGLRDYLRQYISPTLFMLPFNIIGELSRTIALMFRLYGNIMAGTLIVALLLRLAPLFFPILMQALGLLTGLVQAYIFAVLAMVYIASATRLREDRAQAKASPSEGES